MPADMKLGTSGVLDDFDLALALEHPNARPFPGTTGSAMGMP
jgi:hypothetical protein